MVCGSCFDGAGPDWPAVAPAPSGLGSESGSVENLVDIEIVTERMKKRAAIVLAGYSWACWVWEIENEIMHCIASISKFPGSLTSSPQAQPDKNASYLVSRAVSHQPLCSQKDKACSSSPGAANCCC